MKLTFAVALLLSFTQINAVQVSTEAEAESSWSKYYRSPTIRSIRRSNAKKYVNRYYPKSPTVRISPTSSPSTYTTTVSHPKTIVKRYSPTFTSIGGSNAAKGTKVDNGFSTHDYEVENLGYGHRDYKGKRYYHRYRPRVYSGKTFYGNKYATYNGNYYGKIRSYPYSSSSYSSTSHHNKKY